MSHSKILKLASIFAIKYGTDHISNFVPEFNAGDILEDATSDNKFYWLFVKYDYITGNRNTNPSAVVFLIEKDQDLNDPSGDAFYMDRKLYTPGSFGGPAYQKIDPEGLQVYLRKGEYNLYADQDKVSSKNIKN
jgi:hypothetical protein